ncbi:MAG: RdgB/HAM1 family non-canonical purine NTP pyrophosphatase [Bacteroidetes bacterium]|nr:RdgB/HAM1 family non-canonical purine NTP pyrophosphatase [Bacteroidota bacterium]
MNEIVLASNNKGKLTELSALLSNFSLLSLQDVGFSSVIDEPYETFEQNAFQKASTLFQFCGKHVLADDSGLCVHALNDAPGVHSAYFGGEPRSDEKNNHHLLDRMQGQLDRSAYYKAVLCLIWHGKPYFFEGICEGTICHERQGSGGFGYDPLFIPNGYEQSFGKLPASVKNQISHRAKATKKLVAFLKEQTKTD